VDANKRKVAPPQYTKLGGLIYIHGNGAGSDWTLGCVALENEEMKELFDSVTVGTPVTIKP
jgi:lipoprotein-anchoring transpeptidase ErfK/SrfK